MTVPLLEKAGDQFFGSARFRVSKPNSAGPLSISQRLHQPALPVLRILGCPEVLS